MGNHINAPRLAIATIPGMKTAEVSGTTMAETRETIEIVSVNVGMPSVLLSRPSGDIISGIDKRPVVGRSLRLTTTNLEGDGQADTKESRFGGQVHDGPEQAVYAFPVEHYARLEAKLE